MTEQDREKKIAEIREALEKATPGPWENVRLFYVGVTTEGRFYPVAECDDQNNAILIANAPEWLRFLISELDREREENQKLRVENRHLREDVVRENNKLREQFQSAQQEIERLREEREKLIEGLRWYADEQNYDGSEFRLSETEKDEGQRARDILKEIGVTVE